MELSSLGTSRGSCGAISLTPALVTCISLLLFQYFGVLLLWRRPVYMHIYTHIYLMQLRERTLHPCHHSTEPAGSALLPEPPAAGRLPGSLGAKPWGISPFGDGQRGAQSCCSASDSPANAPTPGHAAHGAERARERSAAPSALPCSRAPNFAPTGAARNCCTLFGPAGPFSAETFPRHVASPGSGGWEVSGWPRTALARAQGSQLVGRRKKKKCAQTVS